ncbi:MULTISPECIES: chemotaxis protein CheW [unclassified Deinococcus]|uniref:chemotaxis protein CheW n=1 Tax=unclassified Deinococcus TaxID=2623546 RepID=UPI001C2FBA69|nr:chemotaxis protein CheW [Deinococcus sp. 43]MDK2012140.1 chemotaxis protein CheW [Deinococcus sp. 43]
MTPRAASPAHQALLLRVGQARFLLPLDRVERLYPMVHLPPGPPRVHLRGETLPVVDPRPGWGQPPAPPDASQRLVVVRTPEREAWWVDEAGPILPVTPDRPAVLDGQVVSVLW